MIRRLPRWIWIGGVALAFSAGILNVVALSSFAGQTVSHMTANTTRLGAAIVTGDEPTVETMAAVIGSFFVGAALAGWLINSAALELGQHYSAALLLEAMLIVASIILLQRQSWSGIYLLCGACGLQNGLVSTYSGAVVRTTHVTGLWTDIGVLCGQMLRGTPPDWRRLLLFSFLIGGFMAGGGTGVLLYRQLAAQALFLPATIVLAAALGYRLVRRRSISLSAATPPAEGPDRAADGPIGG